MRGRFYMAVLPSNGIKKTALYWVRSLEQKCSTLAYMSCWLARRSGGNLLQLHLVLRDRERVETCHENTVQE